MSNTASPVTNAYIVDAEYFLDGKNWLYFRNGGTFEEYKAMAAVITYKGKTYVKRGWNSDTFTVAYQEGVAAYAA
jgi:hypothetical protein